MASSTLEVFAGKCGILPAERQRLSKTVGGQRDRDLNGGQSGLMTYADGEAVHHRGGGRVALSAA